MKILKEKGAYWSCLQRGHRLLECKKKRPCGVNRCTKWHHQTLHKDEKIETSLQGISRSASVCDNNIRLLPTANTANTHEVRLDQCPMG